MRNAREGEYRKRYEELLLAGAGLQPQDGSREPPPPARIRPVCTPVPKPRPEASNAVRLERTPEERRPLLRGIEVQDDDEKKRHDGVSPVDADVRAPDPVDGENGMQNSFIVGDFWCQRR